uniref:Uncharacterized protein n=1 Tax=Oryza glumipatula TaxID=40148 RepID=A0A0E0ABI3_9ORYZ
MADVSRAFPALLPEAGRSRARRCRARGHNVPSARRQSRRWAAAHLFRPQPRRQNFFFLSLTVWPEEKIAEY